MGLIARAVRIGERGGIHGIEPFTVNQWGCPNKAIFATDVYLYPWAPGEVTVAWEQAKTIMYIKFAM